MSLLTMTYRDVILNHHYFLIMLENEKIITFPFCCTTQYQIECVITYWAVLPSSSFLFFLNMRMPTSCVKVGIF